MPQSSVVIDPTQLRISSLVSRGFENQNSSLKRFYPVKRSKTQQSFDRLELADGGTLVALPGKDPDKIRGEHPSILFKIR
jgi:hypothetical protein